MKLLNKIWCVGLMAISIALITPKQGRAQDGGYVTDQEFYDGLQPYGTWVSDDRYGNVWVPNVDEDFRPYATRGHWVLTEYGNTWVSDYPWGWATFHYGRWRYDDYYGWEWIPGHHWAPAWVSWRHGRGYYGWAPMQPGISITLSFGRSYRVPDNYWVCAPEAYIMRPDINNYYVPPSRSVTIIHNTTIINNTYVNNNVTYVAGPRVQEIRQVTHNNNVTVYNINNAPRPGVANVTNNTVNIYRPAVKAAPDAHPARVVDATAYRNQHPNERIANHANVTVDHTNAAKLAVVARSTTPDNKVVRVNQPANNRPQATPAQPNVAQPVKGQRQQAAQQQAAQPTRQHGNQPAQPAQQKATQQAQQQAQQQKAAQQAQQQAQQQKAAQQAQQQAQQQKATQQAQQQAQQQKAAQQAQQQAQQQKATQQAQQQAQQQKAAQQAQQQKAAQQAQQQKAALQAQQQVQQQKATQQAQQQVQQQKAAQQAQQQAQQQRQQQAQQRAQNAQRQQQAQRQQKPKPKPEPPKPDANQ